MPKNGNNIKKNKIDFEKLVKEISNRHEVARVTVSKEFMTNGGTVVMTVYGCLGPDERTRKYEIIETTAYGIDPLGDFLLYAEEISPDVLAEDWKRPGTDSVSVEEGLDRVRQAVEGETPEKGGDSHE